MIAITQTQTQTQTQTSSEGAGRQAAVKTPDLHRLRLDLEDSGDTLLLLAFSVTPIHFVVSAVVRRRMVSEILDMPSR